MKCSCTIGKIIIWKPTQPTKAKCAEELKECIGKVKYGGRYTIFKTVQIRKSSRPEKSFRFKISTLHMGKMIFLFLAEAKRSILNISEIQGSKSSIFRWENEVFCFSLRRNDRFSKHGILKNHCIKFLGGERALFYRARFFNEHVLIISPSSTLLQRVYYPIEHASPTRTF